MSGDLYTRLGCSFAAFRDRIFIEEAARTWTYGQIETAAGRLATRLLELGLAPGERLLAQTDKSIEAIVLYFACLRVGAIYLPLNTDYTEAEIAYFLADAEPALAVCREQSIELFGRLGGGKLEVRTLDQLFTDLPQAEVAPASPRGRC